MSPLRKHRQMKKYCKIRKLKTAPPLASSRVVFLIDIYEVGLRKNRLQEIIKPAPINPGLFFYGIKNCKFVI